MFNSYVSLPEGNYSKGDPNFLRLTCCNLPRFTGFQWDDIFLDMIQSFIELDDGKIYRKDLYLIVKTMVSCRFSLKPIHWIIFNSYSWCFENCFNHFFHVLKWDDQNWWDVQVETTMAFAITQEMVMLLRMIFMSSWIFIIHAILLTTGYGN